MRTYRAAVIGCSRMGGFIDNEVAHVPSVTLPYSHGAGFAACERTDLVACSDLRPEIMDRFSDAHGVPPGGQYTDFRKMIDKVKPDIVSVATMQGVRAEIVIYAADHGVKAIYAEKPMASSMAEAAAMVKAIERNNVIFNMGASRRWHPGYDKMKELIDSGELGSLKSVISLGGGHSHSFDMLLRLNSDAPALWVQAHATTDEDVVSGDTLRRFPRHEGFIKFENDVTGYYLDTGRGVEFEAVGDKGTVTAERNGAEFRLRVHVTGDDKGGAGFVEVPFPKFDAASPTLRLIEDLVVSLDTGNPPRGGVHSAYASTEIIFAFIESSRRNGQKVNIPLEESHVKILDPAQHKTPRYER